MGCSDQLENINRPPSSAISDGHDTTLGRLFGVQLVNHSNQSGVILLENGLDAFVGRVLLARLVERTIDVQYYMFHQDPVGRLLIDQKRRCGRFWSNDQEAAFKEKESRTGMIAGDQRLTSDHLTELWSNTLIRTMITSGSISPMAQTSCTRLIERQARERNE